MTGQLARLTGKDNYFEDFTAGDVYEHARGKTMTEMDNVLITNLVMNTAQGHFNEDQMSKGPMGQRIVFGGITASMVIGLSLLLAIRLTLFILAGLAWQGIINEHLLIPPEQATAFTVDERDPSLRIERDDDCLDRIQILLGAVAFLLQDGSAYLQRHGCVLLNRVGFCMFKPWMVREWTCFINVLAP